MNYISQKLIKSTENILSNLDSNDKKQLTTIVDQVMIIMNKYIKFNMIEAVYEQLSESSCSVTNMGVISNSPFIKKQLNRVKKIILYFNSTPVKIEIYYNFNQESLDENIKK